MPSLHVSKVLERLLNRISPEGGDSTARDLWVLPNTVVPPQPWFRFPRLVTHSLPLSQNSKCKIPKLNKSCFKSHAVLVAWWKLTQSYSIPPWTWITRLASVSTLYIRHLAAMLRYPLGVLEHVASPPATNHGNRVRFYHSDTNRNKMQISKLAQLDLHNIPYFTECKTDHFCHFNTWNQDPHYNVCVIAFLVVCALS